MYQIIRMFDGDPQQRSFAEHDLELLERWSLNLQQPVKGSWVLLESIRRTLMLSIILRCLCKIIKDGVSNLVPVMSVLPVSENTAKWEGRDSEVGPLVSYTDYVLDWNEGKVTTVDAYEMLLLKLCRHAIMIV